MTFRTGWILAGAFAFALASSAAAFAQQTDGTSSASRTVESAAPAAATDAQSSASRTTASKAVDAQSSASVKPDAQSSASRKPAGFVFFQLYDFVKGPLLIAALLVFAAGFAWRIRTLRQVTRPARTGLPPSAPAQQARGAMNTDETFLLGQLSPFQRAVFRIRQWVRRTVFASSPVMGAISFLFHVGLFLVPLLLPAHSVLLRQSLGFGLLTLPDPFLDKLTLVLLALGAFFLLRRIVFPRVRALTTVRDYFVLLLVALPFLTAYAAYHQWWDYRTVVVLHMITGEILLCAIPFTKLGHMPFLIFSRFFLSAERSWRPAARRW